MARHNSHPGIGIVSAEDIGSERPWWVRALPKRAQMPVLYAFLGAAAAVGVLTTAYKWVVAPIADVQSKVGGMQVELTDVQEKVKGIEGKLSDHLLDDVHMQDRLSTVETTLAHDNADPRHARAEDREQ